MKAPTAVVIDDDSGTRKVLKRFLEKDDLGFEVEEYSMCPLNISKIIDASLYLIDYNLPGKNGFEIATELKKIGAKGAKVIITGYPDDGTAINYLEEGIIDSYIVKPVGLSTLREKIRNLGRGGKLTQKVSVGIAGLGRLGRGLFSYLKDYPLVKNIHLFSNYTKKGFEEFLSLTGTFEDVFEVDFGKEVEDLKGNPSFSYILKYVEHEEKTIAHKGPRALESFAKSNIDILFLTTGEYLEEKDVPPRKELFKGSMDKISPILKELKKVDYQGLLVIGSNPMGPNMNIARGYGLDTRKITGASPDTKRAIDTLFDEIKQTNENIFKESIFLQVVGEHGTEIPLFERCLVDGRSLEEVYPPITNLDLKKRLINKIRGKGKKTMDASKKLMGDYLEAPESLAEVVDTITHLQEFPKSSWHCFLDENFLKDWEGAYLGYPVRIKYPELTINPNLMGKKLSLMNLKIAASVQNNLVNDFLNKHPKILEEIILS